MLKVDQMLIIRHKVLNEERPIRETARGIASPTVRVMNTCNQTIRRPCLDPVNEPEISSTKHTAVQAWTPAGQIGIVADGLRWVKPRALGGQFQSVAYIQGALPAMHHPDQTQTLIPRSLQTHGSAS